MIRRDFEICVGENITLLNPNLLLHLKLKVIIKEI